MCLVGNTYGIISLIIGISIIIISTWLLIKKEYSKWTWIILDIILAIITFNAFMFFRMMFC